MRCDCGVTETVEWRAGFGRPHDTREDAEANNPHGLPLQRRTRRVGPHWVSDWEDA
jgi:hypothetical protein